MLVSFLQSTLRGLASRLARWLQALPAYTWPKAHRRSENLLSPTPACLLSSPSTPALARSSQLPGPAAFLSLQSLPHSLISRLGFCCGHRAPFTSPVQTFSLPHTARRALLPMGLSFQRQRIISSRPLLMPLPSTLPSTLPPSSPYILSTSL